MADQSSNYARTECGQRDKAARIRAYAIGHAHAEQRTTPNAEDWRLARLWFDGIAFELHADPCEIRMSDQMLDRLAGMVWPETEAEIVLDADERRGD